MDRAEVDRDGGVDRDLLRELLATYGPCGQDDAVREVCGRERGPLVDEMWVDSAGNLVGLVRGGDDTGDAPVVRVMAHMDELSMLVKRVEPDGSLHVTQRREAHRDPDSRRVGVDHALGRRAAGWSFRSMVVDANVDARLRSGAAVLA